MSLLDPSWLSTIKRESHALLIAIQFLTRLPVRLFQPVQDQDVSRSLSWYPLVGLVMGCCIWLLYASLPGQLPTLLSASLVLSFWIFLSGALHLDGFADCVDAWVGGMGDKDKTLTIMKDPASGPMAIVALILLLMIKLSGLAFVISAQLGLYLIIIPIMARSTIVVIFLTVPYIQDNGLGTALAAPSRNSCLISLLLCLVCLLVLLPLGPLFLLLVTSAIIYSLWRYAVMKRLQGFTGDCAGALLELQELGLLIVLCLQFAIAP